MRQRDAHVPGTDDADLLYKGVATHLDEHRVHQRSVDFLYLYYKQRLVGCEVGVNTT
jgi:hypothetical protein